MKAKQLLMDFKVINWNVAGAKYLEEHKKRRDKFRKELNEVLRKLVRDYKPHVVTLQEVVQYGEDKVDIIDPLPQYNYHSFPLIDTDSLSVRAKWNKLERSGGWPRGTYFNQGNGFLFRKDLPHQPVYALPRDGQRKPSVKPSIERKKSYHYYVEKVSLESGLYFGNRDTEPRAALVAHFVFNPDSEGKPLDIFVVNTHLTTLTTEREGVPEVDRHATKIRLSQLDIIFDGIVSRYNYWSRGRFPERGEHREPEKWESFDRHEPVWILAGDFNSTPESLEYSTIRSVNFLDVVPNKGAGTKAPGAGNPATLILDYVFAGPAFVALDQLIMPTGIAANHVIEEYRVSDHFPMYANIPIWG